MEEEKLENEDSLNLEGEGDALNPEENQDSQKPEPEKVKDKSKELAENYKIRAEKAEQRAKSLESEIKSQKGLSHADLIALVKADVAEDDVQEVMDYAKFKNIPVTEALKSSAIKATLDERREERKTADAAATGNQRSGVSAPSGNDLLSTAQKTGEVPESDEEMEALVEARFQSKSNKK